MNFVTGKASAVLFFYFVSACALFGLAAYQAEFIMDDFTQIVNNPNVHDLRHLPNLFFLSSSHMTGAETGIYYKPIMMAVYSLLWQLTPGEPMLFHFFQILLQALNSLLVYLLFRRFLPNQVAAAGGFLFLCHPMHAETVIYLADLQDLLYLFFGMLAMHRLWGKMQLPWHDLIELATWLGTCVFSKESGFLFVFVTLVYSRRLPRRSFAKVLAVCFLVTATYCLVRFELAGLTALSSNNTRISTATFGTRVLTAPAVIARYLIKSIYPWPLTTTQDWTVEAPTLEFWLPLIGLCLLLWALIAYGRKRGDPNYWLMFWWTTAGLGFHSQILVPLDGTLAPRWFYFTSVGWIGLLLFALQQSWPGFVRPKVAAFTAIAGFFCLLTYARAMEWRNDDALFSAEIDRLPDSFVVQNNYGVQLFKHGDLEGAERHFRASTELAPNWTVNWNNLGAVYSRRGNLDKAIECYKQSIEHGKYDMAYENYVKALVTQNRAQEALTFVNERGLRDFPADEVMMELKGRLEK